MENMEEEPPPTPPTPLPPPPPPFWLQPATTRRPRLPSSALFLSTGFLVAILCISAIIFLVFVIPSLISLTHQVFRPSSVRRSWDSLNLVLILFAVVCGFLGRQNKDEDQRDQDVDTRFDVSMTQSPLITSHQQCSNWYDYEFGDQGHVPKLIRASSSYPDLRQDVSWDVGYDHRPRYYDDSYANNEIRVPRSLGSSRSRRGIDNSGFNKIEIGSVTTLVEKDSVPSPSPPPTPPPPTPPIYYSKIVKSPRKDYESISRRGRKAKVPILKERSPPPPPPPPPAPPPPPPQPPARGGYQCDKNRKKSVTKEILTSIYQQSKRKNKLLLTRKSHENLKDLQQPSPPPTPPPPHNNLSPKKTKLGKKMISSSTNHPTPPKATKFDPTYETTDGGYEYPAIPIPPPPPPPPFKLPPWKFVVDGDYIKINSSPRRGGGSDESEFDDDGDDSTASIAVDGSAAPSAFCPSPDVNTKADDFIARFKATLKLEKINSIKMKEGMGIGLSPLGPDSSPSPGPSPHAMAISG